MTTNICEELFFYVYPSSFPSKRLPQYSVSALYFNEDGDEGAYIMSCRRDGEPVDILNPRYDLMRRKLSALAVKYWHRRMACMRAGEVPDVRMRWDDV